MKKWGIYIIITVLTVALLGLVYVQSIYIKRGLFIQNQLFDQVVNEAMMHAAVHVEQVQAHNYFNSPDNLKQLYQNLTGFSNGYNGYSLIFDNGKYVAQIERRDTVYTFEALNLKELDSLISLAPFIKSSEPDKSELSGLNAPEMVPYVEPGQAFSANNYNQVVQNMAVQMMFGSDRKQLYVDSAKMNEILAFELKRSGIETEFNFALLDGFSLKKVMGNFPKLNSAIIRTAYKTNINLNAMGDQLILMVDFPHKKSFILKSNQALLSSSFVFVMLIAASFAGSIYIIFRQKKLSELKTDFINNMTHELKTPVATISLATEMLGKEKVLEDKVRVKNYTTIINDENKRLGSHIEKVLQIAQLDREELKLKKELLDIHHILTEVLQKFKLRIEDEQAEVVTQFNASKTTIYGDKIHITNMFSNLIDNALKYRSVRYPVIEISTTNNADEIEISVKDNGIGMSASNQKKIFTQFYRVPTGNIHNVKGFGLGLSYVKSMIDAHKGTIKVNSELDKYAKFTLTLPLKN